MEIKDLKFGITRSWPLVLGINLGTKSLKYLFLQRKGRKLKVLGFGRFSLEEEGLASEGFLQLVRWLAKKSKNLKGVKTVLGLEGQQIIVHTESLPALSKKELLQTIQFGIEREFTKEGESVPFVFGYRHLGADPDKEEHVQYLTMGAPEEVIEEKVYPFSVEGIIPNKVTPTVLGIQNLVHLIPDVRDQALVGILDIGAQRSLLVVIKNGKIDYFRDIVIGGDDFTKGITGTVFHEGRAIQLKTEEALEFKLKYGYPMGLSEGLTFLSAPISEIGMMMRPVVERLAGEIQRSLGFYQEKSGGQNLDQLFLIGGGAKLKHLPEALSEKIGIPIGLLPRPEGLEVSGDREQQKVFNKKYEEQAIGLSLALESSEEGNLLPPSYKKIHKMALLQKGLRYLAAAVVLLCAFFTFQYRSKIYETKELNAVMEARVARSINSGPIYAALQAQKQVLDVKMGTLNQFIGQDETLIQVLRLISHAVPENLTLIYLEYGEEEVDPRKARRPQQQVDAEEKPRQMIRIRGVSQAPTNDVRIYLAQLIVELEKSRYFSDIEFEQDEYSPEENQYGFEFIAYLVGNSNEQNQ